MQTVIVSVGSTLSGGYLTGDRGSDSLDFEGVVTDTSIWGGSSADTTNDGADYVTFAAATTNAYIQLNAGADTLLQLLPDSVHRLGWCWW